MSEWISVEFGKPLTPMINSKGLQRSARLLLWNGKRLDFGYWEISPDGSKSWWRFECELERCNPSHWMTPRLPTDDRREFGEYGVQDETYR